jgi:hypothetical protein
VVRRVSGYCPALAPLEIGVSTFPADEGTRGCDRLRYLLGAAAMFNGRQLVAARRFWAGVRDLGDLDDNGCDELPRPARGMESVVPVEESFGIIRPWS